MQASKKNIKTMILDVDGVLTDGKIYLDAAGNESKSFHTQDGYGLQKLQSAGIKLAIISGRNSAAVTRRMQELKIQHVYQGIQDKMACYQQLLQSLQLNPEQIAYIGDDLPDLEVMKAVGLALTVANAVPEVKSIATYCAQRSGGNGGVREICDWLLQHHYI